MSTGIHKAYMAAGPNFLAVRLGRIFTKIETEEDRILHNDMLADVLKMIEGKEQTFFRTLAQGMMYQKVDRKKRFLLRLAQRVLSVGQ